MKPQATRLGTSPILLDWTGMGTAGFDATDEECRDTWSKLAARFEKGEVGFFDSPVTTAISEINACEKLADEIRSRGGDSRITDCLFIGIGGSSLGPLSLLQALKHRASCHPGSDRRSQTSAPIQFHFMENPDPTDWLQTTSRLNPAHTLILCVAKSGTTFETLAQFILALEWMGQARWKSNVVAITDPVKGDLKKFATMNGIPTLHIHPSLGGRFSIFSPVGLFPALLSDLSAKEFLKGAELVREFCLKNISAKNPLLQLAHTMLERQKREPIHVMMPYATPLKTLAAWWVQLWAESLGKDGKGFTPLQALGAVDQHSILQLLRDGPADKLIWFVTLAEETASVEIPKQVPGLDTSALPAFRLLQGHSLFKLLKIEQSAIEKVLTRRNRSHFRWTLDNLSEKSLGSFYFALSVLTAYTGTAWEVDPFDQPGVEEGKIYIRDALEGRAD